MTLGFLDILRPARVVTDRIDAEPNNLAVALVELGLEPGHVAELGRADRGEVLWMGEQDGPSIADPLVEVDLALSGVGGEVGSFAVDPQCHELPPLRVRLFVGERVHRAAEAVLQAHIVGREGTQLSTSGRLGRQAPARLPWLSRLRLAAPRDDAGR